MSTPKTRPTAVSVESHIAAIAKEEQREDAQRLVDLMRKVTRQEPHMWGPTIVGFGSYHYKYASGHEGDAPVAGFAARGRELVVYIEADFAGRDDLLAKLGEHRTGKVCVYIKRLANVDLKILEKLVEALGATPVRHRNWYLCCGKASQDDHVPARMMKDLLETVHEEKADLLCLICPTCFGQFDHGQAKIAERYEKPFATPAVYYFQLLAFAQGTAYDQLGFERHRFKPEVLRRFEA